MSAAPNGAQLPYTRCRCSATRTATPRGAAAQHQPTHYHRSTDSQPHRVNNPAAHTPHHTCTIRYHYRPTAPPNIAAPVPAFSSFWLPITGTGTAVRQHAQQVVTAQAPHARPLSRVLRLTFAAAPLPPRPAAPLRPRPPYLAAWTVATAARKAPPSSTGP